MSGLVKGIGKVFKKVFNAVKKVAFPLLAIGAIVFTGGAALGLAPLAGGWGGAVGSALSAMGVSTTGTLGSILTGAVTQAGTGAAIGGLTSLATGGDFTEGAAKGGMIGAVTGGVMGSGLLGGASKAAGTVTASGRNAPAGMIKGSDAIAQGRAAAGLLPGGAVGGPSIPDATKIATPATGYDPSTLASDAGTGGGRLLGKVLTSPVAGQVIGGIGQGLMSGMAAKEASEADKEEQERITGSYDVGPGAYDQAAADTTARPTPEAKWGRRGRASYNPQSGRIEYV